MKESMITTKVRITTAGERIGQGWQFAVFSAGGGRVLKVPLSRRERLWRVLKESRLSPHQVFKRSSIVESHIRESLSGLAERAHLLDGALLGNPVFLPNCCYEQDCVAATVGEELYRVELPEQRQIIDRYVDLTLGLLQQGVMTQSFLPAQNCGITTAGKVILIDLGEMIFRRDQFVRRIQEKRWRDQSILRTLTKEIRPYFLQQMDKRLGPGLNIGVKAEELAPKSQD